MPEHWRRSRSIFASVMASEALSTTDVFRFKMKVTDLNPRKESKFFRVLLYRTCAVHHYKQLAGAVHATVSPRTLRSEYNLQTTS